MTKRIIICCDGTWNKLVDQVPSNVVRIYEAIPDLAQDGMRQVRWYQEGIGTKWYDRWPGGAFGAGIDDKIKEAYKFLCQTYEAGDELYFFGYSRGAYTVRSLGGLVHCAGLIQGATAAQIDRAYKTYRERNEEKRHEKAQKFRQANDSERVPITLMVCWDTVGALGIPDLVPNLPIDFWLNQPYRFHNTNLSELIANAFHIAALDEQRKIFQLTPMNVRPNAQTKLRQLWFAGTHETVGSKQGDILADVTLDWVVKALAAEGLGLTVNLNIDTNRIAPENLPNNVPDDQLQYFAEKAGESFLAQLGLKPRQIEGTPNPENISKFFHPSIQSLWCRRSGYPYRPPSIEKSDWQEVFDRQCQQ
jgi:uncharacterized protein (DUF2235 family)